MSQYENLGFSKALSNDDKSNSSEAYLNGECRHTLTSKQGDTIIEDLRKIYRLTTIILVFLILLYVVIFATGLYVRVRIDDFRSQMNEITRIPANALRVFLEPEKDISAGDSSLAEMVQEKSQTLKYAWQLLKEKLKEEH